MNALLFVLAVALCASAVLSSPVPRKYDGTMANPVDVYNDHFKKLFPELKFTHPQPFNDDFFTKDTKNIFEDLHPQLPSLWPKGFSDDIFKNFNDKFKDLKDLKNDTIENVKEVDGNIVHEKERTYAKDDENNHFRFVQKTVIIRPKNEADKKYGTDEADKAGEKTDVGTAQPANRNVFHNNEKPATGAASNSNNNPDDEVEMIHQNLREYPSEAIHDGISNNLDDIREIDLSNDTRINDYYKGPPNPDAELVDVPARRFNREKPYTPMVELYSNDLDGTNQHIISLEHDTDVNDKTPHLPTEVDAEIFDTNAIRRKKINK